MNEVAIRLGRPLRGVVLSNPAVPLPPPPPPPTAAPSLPAGPDPAELLRHDRQAIETVLAQLRHAAGQLASQYELMREQMRKAAVEMAAAVAGRLLHERIAANDFAVERLVREVIAHLPASPAVSIHLHPEDLQLLQQRLGESPLLQSDRPAVQMRADPALARGSCRAETEGVEVLADLAVQLADLRQHLLWSVGDAEPQPSPAAL